MVLTGPAGVGQILSFKNLIFFQKSSENKN